MSGFSFVFAATGYLEVTAIAFKGKPDNDAMALLGIPAGLAGETDAGSPPEPGPGAPQ